MLGKGKQLKDYEHRRDFQEKGGMGRDPYVTTY